MSGALSSSSGPGPVAERLRNTICIPLDSEMAKIAEDLPGTSITLHRLFFIVAGVCMAIAGILCLFNFLSHLIWRRNIQEQKHLMRMIILPFMFAIFSWASIGIYGLGSYLDPIPRLYESYCICTFFHLMVQVLHPDESTRDQFFIQTERAQVSKKRVKHVHDRGSYRFYRYNHMVVHMAPLLLLILTIVEEVVAYRECRSDEEAPQAAHAVMAILEVFLTVMPLMALLRMYRRFSAEFQGTRILSKFWTIKGLIALYMTQTFAMAIVDAAANINPTRYMSLADFTYGIFPFMVCCETFLFSILQIWTLSALQYRNTKVTRISGGRSKSDASILRYLFSVIIPLDVFRGMGQAIKFLVRLPLGSKRFDYTAGTGVGHQAKQDVEAGRRLNNGQYEMLASEDEPVEYRAPGRAPM